MGVGSTTLALCVALCSLNRSVTSLTSKLVFSRDMNLTLNEIIPTFSLLSSPPSPKRKRGDLKLELSEMATAYTA